MSKLLLTELTQQMNRYNKERKNRIETFLSQIQKNAKLLLKNKRKDSRLVRDALGRSGTVERLIRSEAPCREIAWEAFLLGRAVVSARIENIAPDAQIGWKQRQKGKLAAQKRFGTPQQQKRDALHLKAEFDEIMSHPRTTPLSKAAILRKMASDHNCSPRTIDRHLNLLKK